MLDSVRLGAYPTMDLATARNRWRELKGARVMGSDPKAQANKKAPTTVSELVDAYIDGYAKRIKKSWRNDDRILQKDLVPKFGGEPATLTRNDVKELLAEVAHRGDEVATQLLAVCRKAWNYGIEEDLIKTNPWQRLKVIKGVVMASETKVKKQKKAKQYFDDLALQKLLLWLPKSSMPL